MAVDATMRKLKVPPKFMPYLEKHRVYELFHDLGNHLAMEQPDDILLSLKHCLERMEKGRDRRVILLLTPPYLDRVALAHKLSLKTGRGILTRYLTCKLPGNHLDPHALAINTAATIESSGSEGWILADYPDTQEEAKILIEAGVLPTHVFLLQPDVEEGGCEQDTNLRSVETTPSILLESDDAIFNLKHIFKSSLKTVKMKDMNLEDITNACTRLAVRMPFRPAPKVFRLALIGPRGSRRRTLAKILHSQLKLVRVDMNDLINAARNLENDIGDEFRTMDKHCFPYTRRMILNILKTRMYQEDCLRRGYVLTNFPCDIEDFVLLDSLDTPPNRVIFLSVEDSECQARLDDRVINMYTGALHSKRTVRGDPLLASQTLTHPEDDSCNVAEAIKFYNRRVQGMLDYCGGTCSVVDAGGEITALLERVEAVLMGPSPAAKPRSGRFPPRPSKEYQSDTSSGGSRMPYPVTRPEVVPLIDSEVLLARYHELKRDPRLSLGTEERSAVSTESENVYDAEKQATDSEILGTDEGRSAKHIVSNGTDKTSNNIDYKNVLTLHTASDLTYSKESFLGPEKYLSD